MWSYPVLGGAELPLEHCSGIVLFPADHDSHLRYYRRKFTANPYTDQPKDPYLCGVAKVSRRESREPEKCQQTRDAYPWAVAKAYCRKSTEPTGACQQIWHTPEECRPTHDRLLINYASEHYDFGSMHASDVLRLYDDKSENALQQLENKIVLFGGSYRAARDEYRTPFGPMPGVKILAHAIESELQGRIRFASHWVMFLVEIAVGVCLAVLHNSAHVQEAICHWIPGTSVFLVVLHNSVRGRHLMDIIIVMLLLLCASYVTFSSFALWANFVPILVAIWLHQIWDNYQKLRKLRQRKGSL